MLPWSTSWLVVSKTCIILEVSLLLLSHNGGFESVSMVVLLAFLKVPYLHRQRTRRTKITRLSSPGIELPSTKQCTINAKSNLSGLSESSRIRLENLQFPWGLSPEQKLSSFPSSVISGMSSTVFRTSVKYAETEVRWVNLWSLSLALRRLSCGMTSVRRAVSNYAQVSGTWLHWTLTYHRLAAVCFKNLEAKLTFVESLRTTSGLPIWMRSRYCLTWYKMVSTAGWSHLPSKHSGLSGFIVAFVFQFLERLDFQFLLLGQRFVPRRRAPYLRRKHFLKTLSTAHATRALGKAHLFGISPPIYVM